MDEPDAQGSTKPAPQFRTYASDVAKLTGSHTPLARDMSPSQAPVVTGPVSMPIKTAPVPVPAVTPTPPPAPVTPLPTPAAPAPTPAPTVPPPPPVKPYEPPPATIIPKAPNTDESREAILARLRAKAAPAMTPVAPPPATIIPKAPSTDEAREQVLARLKARSPGTAPTRPSVPPPPPGLPPVSKQPTVPESPIHTYKSDFSDHAKEKGASKISIIAAEQNAIGNARALPQIPARKKNLVPYIAGAVLLILAGGASIYFAFAFVTGHPPVIIAPSVPSLIFADERVELKGTSGELRRGLAELSTHTLPSGGVAIAYVTFASTTAKGKTVILPADGGALISAMGLPAPEILLRNIDPKSTVGVVHAGDETRPFFIFRVGSFERTFAGMLDWEASMPRDLATFYPAYPEPEAPSVGTSTASSSTPIERPFSVSFVDEVVDNHDVRVLRDSHNHALMLYGYRDKQTLIVARDEAAFSELLARLASTRSQ